MNKTLLLANAIGFIDEDLILESEQPAAKKPLRFGYAAAAAACLCVAGGAAVVVNNRSVPEVSGQVESTAVPISAASPAQPAENSAPPVFNRSSVIWAESDVDDNVGIFIAEEGAFDGFNGKVITKTLSEAFKEHDDDSVFAVAVFYFPYRIDEDFVYNGKTLGEYDKDAWEKCIRSMNLSYIRNNAEYLKYGAEYYMTNTVRIDGVPWTKYDYDRAVELVGEEFISEYFVDGEFLEDEFTRVYDKAREEYHASEYAYKQADDAWKTTVLERETERLEALGINCELRNSADSFIAFMTKDELAELTFDDSGHWIFGLACENDRDVLGILIDD